MFPAYLSCRETPNTHLIFNNFFFFEIRAVYEIVWKNIVERGRSNRWQYGACALHAGNPRLQIHTHVVQHLLLFHWNTGRTKAPRCYVTCIFLILFWHWTKASRFLWTGRAFISISWSYCSTVFRCAHEIFFLALKAAELCKGFKNTSEFFKFQWNYISVITSIFITKHCVTLNSITRERTNNIYSIQVQNYFSEAISATLKNFSQMAWYNN